MKYSKDFEIPKTMKSIKKNVDIEKVSLTNKKERILRSRSPIFESGAHLALFSEKLSGDLIALAKKEAPL